MTGWDPNDLEPEALTLTEWAVAVGCLIGLIACLGFAAFAARAGW